MAQLLIACPLCSATSFSSTNALCLSLVNVASKWLRCTLCEEELRGLDKLTIHLLGHLMHSADFNRHVITESSGVSSSESRLMINPEPLNLVKNHSEEVNQNFNSNVSSTGSLQVKPTSEIRTERPSLKIDDEVMIFFNSNDKNSKTQNKLCEMANIPDKPCDMSSATGLPKITINFNKIIGQQNENNIFSHGENLVESGDEFLNSSSLNEIPNFFLSSDSNPTKKSDSSALPELESQMDLSTTDKREKPVNFLSETSNIEESNIYNNLEKRVGSKSSFLSPRGERVLGYRCDICSLVFPDERILLMHRQLIHVELSEDPSKTKSYKCHLCSKSFVMKGSLMVHMRVAHFGGAVVARLVEAKQLETNAVSLDSAQYTCSICNKGFKKEHQLIQHEKLHDGKQCDVCFKTFTTKYFLRKHKRLHTGEMPYSCNTCNKSFTFQQSYHKHLLYHNDDKPYTCAECGRAFKELSTLHNHQRIHTGEKPFSCETCGKCFRQRVSYLVHRRIHTGVMPYQCQDCGKTFRYKVSERTHKCTVSTPGCSTEALDPPPSTETHQDILPTVQSREAQVFQRLSEDNSAEETEWNPVQHSEEHQAPAGGGQVMSEGFPEPADFFSLVMSPSDRLQHLSLSGDTSEERSPQPERSGTESIDTEALKQLLYDVADYT